ncbi:hypothetical protein C0416_05365 [bacterium]|nr:hypothetical protein [bacterium]
MKINTHIKSLIICLGIASLALLVKMGTDDLAFAQFNENYLDDIEFQTELPTFDSNTHADAIQKPGVSNITSAIFFALDFMKYLLGAVAVLIIIMIGIKLIIARIHIDDVWSKQKDQLIYIATGFILIMIAEIVVKGVFYGVQGEVLDTASQAQKAAGVGVAEIKGMVSAALIIAGAFAVLMLVIAGVKLLTSAGNEEVQTKVKNQITWIVLGLFLLGIAEFAALDVIFPKQGSEIPSADNAKKLIKDVTNFASAFVSICALIFSIYGGYLYVVAAGNEEQATKAKKILIGSVIAIVIGLGAFAIVNTVIQLEPGV